MKLYLYDTASKAVVLELENVLSYTDSRVVTAEGTYGPLAEGYELSETADCAGTLRASWRQENPGAESRIDDLEALMAELLFGGEGE